METDFFEPYPGAYMIPTRIGGRVVRSLAKNGRAVTEWFTIIVDDPLPDAKFLKWHAASAELVDVSTFEDVSGWDPALVYSRGIPGSDRVDFDPVAFFAGNMEGDASGSVVVDVREMTPMDLDEFWSLIAELRGSASPAGVKRLERRLAGLPRAELGAFVRRLSLSLRAAEQPAVAEALERAGSSFGTDSGLFWLLAAIAHGRSAYDTLVGGGQLTLDESEWAAGESLVGVAERAAQARDGIAVEFITKAAAREDTPKTSPATEFRTKNGGIDFLTSPHGKGDVDVRPGPRSAQEMYGRGLLPTVVGSRFLVSRPDGYLECVVLQRIDTRNENVAQHLAVAAEEIALSLGGQVATKVEHRDAHGMLVQSGRTIFVIRRNWKTDLASYRAAYHLA